jgi:hypothetical protein
MQRSGIRDTELSFEGTVFDMTSCSHLTLVLLPEKKDMLRCRHCHLTINAGELGEGYCPECFEVHGRRRYDFDTIEAKDKGKIRYQCEQCGIIIETE